MTDTTAATGIRPEEKLTADVVTSMLRLSPHIEGAAEIEVAAVTAEPVGTGQMATSVRLALEYAAAPAGAPGTVVAKVPSTDEASLAMAAGTNAYGREVAFYRELAPDLHASVPLCHYGTSDETGTDFVLLLEDLAPARSVDQRQGATIDELAAVLAHTADLHGRFWGRADAPWLPVQHVWGALAGQIPAITAAWLDRFGAHVDADLHHVIRELASVAPIWVSTLDDRRTVWHGDLRLDNLLFDARNGRSDAVIVDWQSAASGPGTTDVAYLIGTSLDADTRRAHEPELVALYHAQLASHVGVEGYSFEDCWLDYQAQALYALVLTVPVSMGVQPTERGDAMFAAMATRAAGHVRDLDTVGVLRRLGR